MMLDQEYLLDVLPPGILFVALASTLLPIARWQSLLLHLLSGSLRLAGMAAVGLGAALYFGLVALPDELHARLGHPAPPDFLAATAITLLVLLPVLALLNFTRRLFRTSRRVERLVTSQETMASVLRCVQEDGQHLGARMSPDRRAALQTALASSSSAQDAVGHGTAAGPRPGMVRRTLAQLLG